MPAKQMVIITAVSFSSSRLSPIVIYRHVNSSMWIIKALYAFLMVFLLIYLTKIALPEIIFKYAAQFYIFFRNIYPTNNYYKFFRLFLLEEALKEASSNAFCINQNLKNDHLRRIIYLLSELSSPQRITNHKCAVLIMSFKFSPVVNFICLIKREN